MKSEKEIQEQIDTYTQLMVNTESIEELRRYQGIIWALRWVIEKNEEKKDGFTEPNEGDTDESDE